jgi:hypothetical protein
MSVMSLSMEAQKGPRRTRRFLRFSLRALLIVVAICSVWLGIAFHRAREQARAVAGIKAVPGYVFYDFQVDAAEGIDPSATSDVPSWLLDSLGVDFFHNVTVVGFEGPPVTDDQLAAIESLGELEYLVVGPYVSSKGLVHLRGLTKLLSLNVASSAIDDAGLRHLAALQRLEYLAIQGAPITDSGLEHLKGLENLRDLTLHNTQVTSAGARALSQSLPDCAMSVWQRNRDIYRVAPHGPPSSWGY